MLRDDIVEMAESPREEVDTLSGRQMLISGGAGFLGRYFVALVDELNQSRLDRPCRVTVLDKRVPYEEGSFASSACVQFVKHDVVEPFEPDEKIDFVIHMAAIPSPYYYRAYPLETLEAATTGAKRMLELAREHRAAFLFVSSSEIYGDPDPLHVPTPESYRGNVSCQGPRACYDESKRLGETLSYIYHHHFGLKTNVVRPFNVYGPGMNEKDYRVLPNFASQIKGGRPLKIYGDGRQTRTFCYATDAVVGFVKVLLCGVPGEPYNIGNPEPEITILELARLSLKIVERPLEIHLIEYPDSYPADEPRRRCPDIRKARLQLDYQPNVSLLEGLRRFYGWTEQCYRGDL